MLSLYPDHKYPMPDWSVEMNLAEQIGPDTARLATFWHERGFAWARLLRASFGGAYQWYQSEHFWFICSQDRKTCQRLISWAEHVYARLVKAFDSLSHGLGYRIPVVVTADLETYYDYVCQYYPDGEHATSGGIYLNAGYGHFVFCYHELGAAQSVIAHELAHAFLHTLDIPLWLNEGIAQLAETAIASCQITRTEEILETIDTFWTDASIQEFWTGASFNRQDEGQLQSYHLAHVLTRKLAGDRERFHAFVAAAKREDAGQVALVRTFGVRLEELVTDYLGEGDWAPRPAEELKGESDGESPAANPANVVFTIAAIIERRSPILRVCHDKDDGAWQCLTDGPIDENDVRVVAVEEAVRVAPTVRELAALPAGWKAVRKSPSEK